jgi:hypothetical protein
MIIHPFTFVQGVKNRPKTVLFPSYFDPLFRICTYFIGYTASFYKCPVNISNLKAKDLKKGLNLQSEQPTDKTFKRTDNLKVKTN